MCPHCERDSDWMAIYERGGSTVERQRRDPPHVVLFRDAMLRVKKGDDVHMALQRIEPEIEPADVTAIRVAGFRQQLICLKSASMTS